MAVTDWTPVKVGKLWFAQDAEGEQRPDGGLPSKKAVLDYILKLDTEEKQGKAGVLPPDMNAMNMGGAMPPMPGPGMRSPAGVGPVGPNPLMAMMGKK